MGNLFSCSSKTILAEIRVAQDTLQRVEQVLQIISDNKLGIPLDLKSS